ncbi:DUF2812 domain-containing protein [Shouchella patagoniensis]|uniref:DUF2812 domain-containing protein n=1 Tax=Shouchella patagoniensis TaxID=228576 RepID=UPI0009951DB7|nr:DUF2812 domain-containing protein [Shouchella patagoniensis]
MKNSKYIMSEGLAFAEDLDMQKLKHYSAKGWHVQAFKFMGYNLQKGESADYIYSIDYRVLKDGEKDEYVDLFSQSGWSHVTSQLDTHLFRALPGTKPIYSDQDTIAQKHHNLGRSMLWTTISIVLVTIIAWIGLYISSGTWQKIIAVGAVPLSIIAILTTWTVMTIYKNKWSAEGKRRLLLLTKAFPLLLILLSIFIMYMFAGSNNPIRLLANMIIGAMVGGGFVLLLQMWGRKKA